MIAETAAAADIGVMGTRRATTPIAVKLALVAIAVGAPAWWLAQRQDRVGNEARLSAIASAIAGRDVKVRCPGIGGRVFSWDTVEGSVRVDAAGRPADEARLRAFTCRELDALAEGRRADALACGPGPACADLALAVDVLAHESFHLAGVIDEAATECHAVQTLAWTAEQLGATAEQGAALTRRYLQTGYLRLPNRYRSATCELPQA
jgi:hypothetical protein